MSDGFADSAFNHPEAPVRHSYPLAIRSAGLATAFGLLMRTLPYALVRFGILVGVSVVTIVWFCLTFGVGAWLGARVAAPVGWVWIIGGCALYGYVWYMLLRYALHMIECGHVAVLTELITRNRLGDGAGGMFAHGRAVVRARFGEVNVLFGLNMLVRGVVGAFNRTLDFLGEILPVPGLEGLMRIVNLVLNAATRYVDKAIFSYNLARGDENPWRSGRDGIIYYAQNAREILKTAAWVVVLDKGLTFLAWFLLLAPSAVVALMLPESVRSAGTIIYLLIAALFAANIRSAFLKPLFLIMVMTKFHILVQGQAINEAWDARLTQVSGKFSEIKKAAAEWGAPTRPVSTPPVPAGPQAAPG